MVGMPIRVELYGIPRHRAGIATIDVEADNLGEALRQVGRRLPQLNDVCLDDGRIRTGFLVNLNGRTFIGQPGTPLQEGDCVLILSSDVGG